MMPVTLINLISVKPGMIDEFIDAQHIYSSTPPAGLLGGRMYRSIDGKSVILISLFESTDAQERFLQADAFKEHLSKLRPMVESSNPIPYDEAYTYGDFK